MTEVKRVIPTDEAKIEEIQTLDAEEIKEISGGKGGQSRVPPKIERPRFYS